MMSAIRTGSKASTLCAICVLITASAFPGCTKEGKAPTPSSQGTGRAEVQPRSTQTALLRIMPDAPTVLSELVAVYSGTQKAIYQWQRNGAPVPGVSADRLPVGQFLKGDTIAVTVANDAAAGRASVFIVNSLPTVVSVPVTPKSLVPGIDVTAAPVGHDADGDAVKFRYQWTVNDQALPDDSPVLRGSQFKQGDTVSLTVTPYDDEAEGKPFVSRNTVIPNSAPAIVSEPPKDFQGDVYTYQVVAQDPDGDPIEYSLAAAPAGMSIDARTGVITWPINEKSGGAHAIEIVARDPAGMKTTQKYTLTITPTTSLEGGVK